MAGEKLRPEDFSVITSPQVSEDYESMPWSEVGSRAFRNLPGSFVEAGKGIIEAAASPVETVKAMGDVGYGLGSMAYGALGGEQDPASKAENERLARAVVEPYSALLEGRTGPFKKELAENPVGPLSMIVPGVGGGVVKTGELLGKAGAAGSALSKLGRGIEIAGSVVDPARAALEAGRAVKTFGPRTISSIQQLATGTPDAVFEKAFEAGAARGLDAGKIREGFNQFYQGHGDVVGLSQDIENAVSSLKNKASQQWISDRGAITGASKVPIDYSQVSNSFADAFKNYGGPPRGKTSAFPEERAALMDAMKLVREYTRYAPGTGKNTLEGLDELKRALWARAKNAPGGAGDAYKKIHAAVRETAEKTSPEYAALMDRYSALLDEMDTIKKVSGAGPRTDASTQLMRAIKAFSKAGGEDMLQRIAAADPTIPYKIAGAALNQNPVGLRQIVVGGSTAGPAIAAAISSGDPIKIAAIVPALIGGAVISSPRAMGKASYAAGRVAAGAGALGDLPLGPVNLGDIVSGAAKSAYPSALAAEQLQFAQDRLGPEETNTLQIGDGFLNIREPGQANGGRIQRKSGGRIKSSPISDEVRKVRALLSEKTASMLSMPDDAVATALNIAKGNT
jgi:hypothetical protein